MRRAALPIAAAALVLLLAGCSSDESESAAASPSPTPTPTPSSVVWANGVCEARDGVNAAVGALGRNLSYDITSERSALEQIDRQLRIQVLALGESLNELGTALQAVPVDFQQANDLVAAATKAKTDTSEALGQARTHLDAMVNADNVVTGVAEAGQALVAGKAAFEAGSALVTVVSDATSTATGELSDAFAAAPACQDASPAAS